MGVRDRIRLLCQPGEEIGLGLLRYGFAPAELHSWGLNDEQFALAVRSDVYRELVRPVGDPYDYAQLYSLTRLWEAAKRPVDKEPRAYIDAEVAKHRLRLEEARSSPDPDAAAIAGTLSVEDRGDDGVFADWEATVWYALALAPESITINDALDLAC